MHNAKLNKVTAIDLNCLNQLFFNLQTVQIYMYTYNKMLQG